MNVTRPLHALAAAIVISATPALLHAQTEPAEGADTIEVALPDVTPVSYTVPTPERALIRSGGFPREGFDDVEIPTLLDLPYDEIVDPERYVPGSLSMGTTSDGVLYDASRLPVDGVHHTVLPAHRERETHYGTEELVSVILDAAGYVGERSPGTRLAVGNMAVREGGDIRWSRSHNNGRDADLAFFVEDESGDPVDVDDLVTVRRRGQVRGQDLYFDVERNWLLVEGLLTSPSAQIQWIFVYNPLKRMLLEHAQEIGADPDVIARAEEILHQPGDSAPHNDHFHLRIYCSREDRLEGCVNIGPLRDNAVGWEADLDTRVNELLRGLMDPDPDIAQACADFLARLEPRESALEIAASVPHQSLEVQLDLLDLLGDLDQPGVTGPLIPLAASTDNAELSEKLYWLFGHLADPGSGPWLARLVHEGDATTPDGTPVPLAAATALRNITVPETVPDLIAGLTDPRPEVRAAVANVLHRTTCAVSPVDPGVELDPEAFATLITFWEGWWSEHADEPREQWLERAFSDAGYSVGDLTDDPNLPGLVAALDDDLDPLRFAADRMLNQHTRGWTPSEGWDIDRRERYWRRRVD